MRLRPKSLRIHRAGTGVLPAAALVFLLTGLSGTPAQGTAKKARPASDRPAPAGAVVTAHRDAQTAPPAAKDAARSRSAADRLYDRAAAELHRKQFLRAEQDARRAVQFDPKFADAEALAATAALGQRRYSRARSEAIRATQIDERDEKAWLALATADNYLSQYREAARALRHISPASRSVWQVAYQWSRAEAGQNHAAGTLMWANRAALHAPADFAPLHLLRASALLANGQAAEAGGELETYLRLRGKSTPKRAALERELKRIRTMAAAGSRGQDVDARASTGSPPQNALAN